MDSYETHESDDIRKFVLLLIINEYYCLSNNKSSVKVNLNFRLKCPILDAASFLQIDDVWITIMTEWRIKRYFQYSFSAIWF